MTAQERGGHPEQEGEAGVAVGDVQDPPPLEVHQAHDDLAQHREADVDAGRLPQPLPRRPALPLALAPWGGGAASQRSGSALLIDTPFEVCLDLVWG